MQVAHQEQRPHEEKEQVGLNTGMIERRDGKVSIGLHTGIAKWTYCRSDLFETANHRCFTVATGSWSDGATEDKQDPSFMTHVLQRTSTETQHGRFGKHIFVGYVLYVQPSKSKSVSKTGANLQCSGKCFTQRWQLPRATEPRDRCSLARN